MSRSTTIVSDADSEREHQFSKSFKMNASDLLVLTVSAIFKNAYKWSP